MDSLRLCRILMKNRSLTFGNSGVGHAIKTTCLGFWVRLGHGLIIVGIIFQQISGEDLDLMDAHATIGILLPGWVIFRLVWGFIGPHYARFSSFPIPRDLKPL